MKLYLSNQEVVLALHKYLVEQRNCVRDTDEKPNFQVTSDNRGLLMIEVDGYEPNSNTVHNPTDEVVQQIDAPTADDNTEEEINR